MTVAYYWFGLACLIALFALIWFLRYYRRRSALSQKTPDRWKHLVFSRLPIVHFLSDEQQERFFYLLNAFLYDKRFVGCSGLTVTEDMRVTISAGAVLLIVNRPEAVGDAYNDLKWIYIYPGAFFTTRENADELGVVSKKRVGMLGESWSNGKVVLSWSDVDDGLLDFNDGSNVLLHEFAHQLDGESGDTNGAPLMRTRQAYSSWAKVMSKEFGNLQDDAQKGRRAVLDFYGATNEAEFFAVATETFFENPKKLKDKHESLYTELSRYYGFDPCHWE